MSTSENLYRIWCHFCKRFVLSALIRVHRSSDQHRTNYEASQPPPDIFAAKDSSDDPSEVIEIESTTIDGASASDSNKIPSQGTIWISSSSRGRLGPKYASDVTKRHLSEKFNLRPSRSVQHTESETIHDTTTIHLPSNPSSLPSLDGSSDDDNASEHSTSHSSTLPPLSVILDKRARNKHNKTIRTTTSSHDSFNPFSVPEGWEIPEILFSSIGSSGGSQKSNRTFQTKSGYTSTCRSGLTESHSSNNGQETSTYVISESDSENSDQDEYFGETRDFSSKNWNDSTVIISDSDSQEYDSYESLLE